MKVDGVSTKYRKRFEEGTWEEHDLRKFQRPQLVGLKDIKTIIILSMLSSLSINNVEVSDKAIRAILEDACPEDGGGDYLFE